jgi:hypothetical protein
MGLHVDVDGWVARRFRSSYRYLVEKCQDMLKPHYCRKSRGALPAQSHFHLLSSSFLDFPFCGSALDITRSDSTSHNSESMYCANGLLLSRKVTRQHLVMHRALFTAVMHYAQNCLTSIMSPLATGFVCILVYHTYTQPDSSLPDHM